MPHNTNKSVGRLVCPAACTLRSIMVLDLRPLCVHLSPSIIVGCKVIPSFCTSPPPPPISSVSILLLDAGFSLEEGGGGWRFSSSKDFRPTRALTLFSMFESSSLSCEPLFMKRSLGFGFRFGSIFESMMIGFWLFRVSCLMIYGWVKNCGDKMTILRVRKKFSFMMFQAEGVRYY